VTNLQVLGALRRHVEDQYRARTPRSRTLHEQAESYLPGGDTRNGILFRPYPTYIDAGHGSYLTDADGNEILDFTFNSTSLIHGHAHPAIVEAIRVQASRGTAWNAPNAGLVGLAQLLCARVPSLEVVRFCNSGTEANMHALKAARAYTGRDHILKMAGAYHGTYEPEHVLLASFNECESTAQLIRAHRDELAAVIVTPILTRPALGLPNPGYLEFLRQVTRDNGVLLIFDEVISLRVAYGGAQQHYGVIPDLTAMGKIIGGGLPVGAFGGSADIMRMFVNGDPPSIVHAGTFNGNPLTAAAGLVTMELLDAEAFDRLAALGQHLRIGLQDVLTRRGVALDVTSAGSLVSLDVPPEARSEVSAELMRLLQLSLLTRGIKVSGLLAVSTVTTEADIDRLTAAIDDVLTTFGPAIQATAPELMLAARSPV
jgi:glutamate-1-semialdehyde 2,1-aminomutase